MMVVPSSPRSPQRVSYCWPHSPGRKHFLIIYLDDRDIFLEVAGLGQTFPRPDCLGASKEDLAELGATD